MYLNPACEDIVECGYIDPAHDLMCTNVNMGMVQNTCRRRCSNLTDTLNKAMAHIVRYIVTPGAPQCVRKVS